MMRILLVVAFLAAALLPQRAVAHAALTGSEPASGAVLAQPPRTVVLEFDQHVAVVALVLVDRTNRPLARLQPNAPVGRRIEAALPVDLRSGPYALRWRVVSADSHALGGALVFGIDEPIPDDFPVVAGEPGAGWAIGNAGLRCLVLLAVLFGAGAAYFGVAVAAVPARARRRAGMVAMGGSIAAALAIPARGALLLGVEGELPQLGEAVRMGIATRLGVGMVLATIALLALGAAFRSAHRRPRLEAAIGSVAIASIVTSGHLSTLEPAWLMTPLATAHVAIAAFWLGSLLPLVELLEGDGTRAAAALRRFSRLAIAAVGVLLLIGIAIASEQLGAFQESESTYGAVLLAKLVGVTALVTTALGNRMLHLPALLAGVEAAAARLRRAIRWEAAIATAVILATAILGQTMPPRAAAPLHEAAGPGVAATASGRDASAVIEVVPGRTGRNRIHVEFLDRDGGPLSFDFGAVALSSLEGRHLPGIEMPLSRVRGRFVIDGAEIPGPGRWSVRIEIQLGGATPEILTTEVQIR